MQDTPDRRQLLAAVRRFLKKDLAGAVSDPALRFRLLVAANIIGVVERELGGEQEHWQREVDRLAQLDPLFDASAAGVTADVEKRRALVTESWQRLMAPDHPADEAALMAAVRETLADKLSVVNPRFDLSDEIE